MWPTMVQSSKSSKHTSVAHEPLDWLHGVNSSINSFEPPSPSRDHNSMRNEMMELERWLQEDDALRPREDPWDADNGMPLSPTDVNLPEERPVLAFDDDFTVWISAPADDVSHTSTPSVSHTDLESLDPNHTGASWASLRSVSDFGDDLDDDDDELLPSKQDIEDTSRRLFASVGPSSNVLDGSEQHMESFDLSRVMGVLQNMKEEIAGIDDDDERRKAAAKVALGLVYGLDDT